MSQHLHDEIIARIAEAERWENKYTNEYRHRRKAERAAERTAQVLISAFDDAMCAIPHQGGCQIDPCLCAKGAAWKTWKKALKRLKKLNEEDHP